MLRAIPPLVFVLFYWRGLTIWFYQDDFGWLNLRHDWRGWGDLAELLFAPKAHGNLRPWSENGFFLLSSWLFGIDPLPFRIVVFVTAAGVLLLAGALVRRLTGSETAAFWTQILWTANAAVAVAACWTSIYNQVQCLFFVLLALWLLVRYAETGRAVFYAAQWVVFLAGFGSLESMIVYPLVAAVYAFLFARRLLPRVLPMFGASMLYWLLHQYVSPPAAAGPYALHFDAAIASTLWTYWTWALGAMPLIGAVRLPAWAALTATAVLTLAAAAGVWKGGRFALFAAAWFPILLAPYLPLRDHMMDYYLVAPVMGLAMLGGWAVARHRAAWVPLALYLSVSVPLAWFVTGWHAARARRVENFVLGVVEIRRLEPAKTILLAGVDDELFLAGMADLPFRLFGIDGVYLVPGARGLAEKYTLPEPLARRRLESARAVVYDAARPELRNVTALFRTTVAPAWDSGTPAMINAGDPAFSEFLGPGWEAAAGGYRAMTKSAVVRVSGRGKELVLEPYPGDPIPVTVSAGGARLGLAIASPRMSFPLPPLPGTEIEVRIEAERLQFGFISVR